MFDYTAYLKRTMDERQQEMLGTVTALYTVYLDRDTSETPGHSERAWGKVRRSLNALQVDHSDMVNLIRAGRCEVC